MRFACEPEPLPLSPLQWGRDLLVAERADVIDIMQAVQALLQWGRDLLVAERGGVKTIASADCELQWGRDLLVAESGTLHCL